MQISYFNEYSACLNRQMEFKVYGYAGMPILVFPSQNGRFFEWEGFQMMDTVSDLLENGSIQMFTMDSIDLETWSDAQGNEGHRAWMHEQWYHYICDELLPRIRQIRKDFGNDDADTMRLYTTGCSMGATHAMNFFLRRPDLFAGTIAMSGIYHAGFFFPNYRDTKVYDNSPLDYLPNLSPDHYYVQRYRESVIIFSSGQGAWENEMIPDAYALKAQFDRLHVDAWFDLWGQDVAHDWPWWRVQFPYFVKNILAR